MAGAKSDLPSCRALPLPLDWYWFSSSTGGRRMRWPNWKVTYLQMVTYLSTKLAQRTITSPTNLILTRTKSVDITWCETTPVLAALQTSQLEPAGAAEALLAACEAAEGRRAQIRPDSPICRKTGRPRTCWWHSDCCWVFGHCHRRRDATHHRRDSTRATVWSST